MYFDSSLESLTSWKVIDLHHCAQILTVQIEHSTLLLE